MLVPPSEVVLHNSRRDQHVRPFSSPRTLNPVEPAFFIVIGVSAVTRAPNPPLATLRK
jgi:hypothetical protein